MDPRAGAHQPSPNRVDGCDLPARLRLATREKHHNLNQEVTARLPLCLPPAADDPLPYTKGMMAFGQVYFAFEDFLHAWLSARDQGPRMLEIYDRFNLPSLFRKQRLLNDIETLKDRLGTAARTELDDLAKSLNGFYIRTINTLSAKPHCLLSFVWTMYLALFNGGRWIRTQLSSAGKEFWRGNPIPLSFWGFEDPLQPDSDGLHLKQAFQERFLAAASMLTEDEQRDVIEEAIHLFDVCLELVHLLDGSPMMTDPPSASTTSLLSGYIARSLNAWQYLASIYASWQFTPKRRLPWGGKTIEVS